MLAPNIQFQGFAPIDFMYTDCSINRNMGIDFGDTISIVFFEVISSVGNVFYNNHCTTNYNYSFRKNQCDYFAKGWRVNTSCNNERGGICEGKE